MNPSEEAVVRRVVARGGSAGIVCEIAEMDFILHISYVLFQL